MASVHLRMLAGYPTIQKSMSKRPYHARVSSSLDAFETLSSTLMRAVPGALGSGDSRGDSRKLTAGVEGVQRLCKALVSARYLAGAMDTWGEDLVSIFAQ